MEWEYKTATVMSDPADGRITLLMRDRDANEPLVRTFSALGLDRWELVSVASHGNDLLAFFKRQKLYPIG